MAAPPRSAEAHFPWACEPCLIFLPFFCLIKLEQEAMLCRSPSQQAAAEIQRRRSLGSGPYGTGSVSSHDGEVPRASHELLPPLYENALVGGFVGPFTGDEVSSRGYPHIVPESALMSWVTSGSVRCASSKLWGGCE